MFHSCITLHHIIICHKEEKLRGLRWDLYFLRCAHLNYYQQRIVIELPTLLTHITEQLINRTTNQAYSKSGHKKTSPGSQRESSCASRRSH